MNHSKWPVAAAALAALLSAAPPAPPPPRSSFATDRLWDDGRAEYSTYTGTTERYGESRPTRARLIVVKEDLLRDALVKSERGPVPGRTVEVLKLNFIADFPTGTYAYHQMASVFVERATLEVLEETMSHTEGCGITFVRVGPRRGRLVHEARSYWEGEGDRELPVTWPAGPRPRLYRDALPLSLRAWAFERGAREWRVWLLPGQVSGRSPVERARPIDARVRRAAGGTLAVPAGRFDAVRFVVTGDDRSGAEDSLWFDARPPHVLLRLVTAGRRLDLRRTQRLDYWNFKAPGDEARVE